jgi:hypothetical protein
MQGADAHAAFPGDDCIDIGGHFYTAVQFLPNTPAIVITSGADGDDTIYQLGAGDVINVYSPSLQFLGSATLASAVAQVGNPGIASGTIDSIFGDPFSQELFYQVLAPACALTLSLTQVKGSAFLNQGGHRPLIRGCVLQIKLTSFPSAFANAPFNSIITVPTESGSGTAVVGNTIFNSAGRGVSVHGLNAIIQGNNIRHVTAAVSVGGDTGYQEGTFPSNVTVSVSASP